MRLGAAGYCAWGAAVSFVAIATVAHAAIGTAVSVAPSATNSRGGASRPLAAQDPLEQNDRIRTTGQGAVQTRFNDDTILTIGPNSEVVLDRYVFDGSRARNVTVQVVRGALRFVSGKSPSEVYQIKTPVATIGVRGTAINMLYEGGRLIMETPAGLSTICLAGTSNCRDLAAGGAALSIGAGGFSPASAADTARMNRAIQLAQIQLAQQGGGQGGTGKGSGNNNGSDTSDVLSTAPPVVPAVTFIPGAVISGPPTGPGPAFPDFITIFRFTGRTALPFEHITSTFDFNHNCTLGCANYLYASRASTKWDIGTDALRSVTLAVTPNPANDPNPTTVTRGTAKVVDLFTGTANVPGYGVVPIYQMATWADGTVLYSQVGGPAGTVTFGPNDALSVIGWGYTGSLFDTPLTFGRTVQFSLEHAGPVSWTDGRSPFGTFTGTAAVSIAASGLSYGLNATVNHDRGRLHHGDSGGHGRPLAERYRRPLRRQIFGEAGGFL